MDRWVNKVAVVTGASAGIGAAVALDLAKHGLKVIAVARRLDRLQELEKQAGSYSGKLYPKNADVSNENDIKSLFAWIKATFGTIHILINNAGISRMGFLTNQNPEYWRKIFDLNVLGVSICAQEAVAIMKETGVNDGHIINVNSMLGHSVPIMPNPIIPMYIVSKHALTALTETLRQELRHLNTNIKVTSVSPGMVETEFGDAARAAMDKEELEKINLGQFASQLNTRPKLSSQHVSDAVLYVLSTPPSVQVHELMLTAIC